MDLEKFAELASRTDDLGVDEAAIRIGLFGIAGEAGSVVTEAKKYFRDEGPLPGFSDRVAEELGDLLWYVALVSRRLGINLNEVAKANLTKADALWSRELPALPAYDGHGVVGEQFPREMEILFEEDSSHDPPLVRMIPQGELAKMIAAGRERKGLPVQVGDVLDDNIEAEDGYRYHDIIHLAHAAVLGWSPVLRALIGAKRKSVDDYDRTQDGARAMAIEEGIAAFVFNFMELDDFAADALSWDLFKHVRATVRGLEVADQPVSAWRHAYTQAFEILPILKQNHGGLVCCNLDTRELTLVI